MALFYEVRIHTHTGGGCHGGPVPPSTTITNQPPAQAFNPYNSFMGARDQMDTGQ